MNIDAKQENEIIIKAEKINTKAPATDVTLGVRLYGQNDELTVMLAEAIRQDKRLAQMVEKALAFNQYRDKNNNN